VGRRVRANVWLDRVGSVLAMLGVWLVLSDH
jgi:hypothetical protein